MCGLLLLNIFASQVVHMALNKISFFILLEKKRFFQCELEFWILINVRVCLYSISMRHYCRNSEICKLGYQRFKHFQYKNLKKYFVFWHTSCLKPRIQKIYFIQCLRKEIKMKCRKLVIFGILLSIGITTVSVGDVAEFEFSTGYFGKYIWRGQNISDDPVFQPDFSGSYKGFTAGIWGNLETTNINSNSGEFTEIDYYIDYSSDVQGVDNLGYSVGMITYEFPVNGSADDTTELYAGVSLDVPANPSVMFYRDVDEAKDGTYISVGLGHSFEDVFKLAGDTPVGMDIGATLGWGNTSYNKFYWGAKPNGKKIGGEMNDLVLTVAFPFELAGLSITASANYVTLVGDDIRKTDTYGRGRDDSFVAGIGFSVGF